MDAREAIEAWIYDGLGSCEDAYDYLNATEDNEILEEMQLAWKDLQVTDVWKADFFLNMRDIRAEITGEYERTNAQNEANSARVQALANLYFR